MSLDSERAAPTGSRKRRGHGHERRAEILAAARELFLSEGYETVTTRKLARRAGLSQTGLYVYFDSKEAILDTICRESATRLFERLKRVEAEVDLGLDRLRAIGETYVGFGLEYPDEYQLSFMVNFVGREQHGKDLSKPFDEQPVGMQVFLFVYEQMARLSEAGHIRPMDTLVATQTVWSAVHGIVALLVARPQFPWADRRTLIDAVLDMVVEGLRRPSDDSPHHVQ